MIIGGYRDINVGPVIARVFEKVGYLFHAKESSENSLAPSQFAIILLAKGLDSSVWTLLRLSIW